MTGATFPQHITVGPLEFGRVASGLRHIRFRGAEVLSGLEVVVRDPSWGTVTPDVLDAGEQQAADCYTARWRVRHRDGEISFGWQGLAEARVSGPDEAKLSFTMEGSADRDFLSNRIGLCLLHPMWLAGVAAEARTAGAGRAGGWTAGAFPAAIAPFQPFMDFTGLRHPLPDGGTAEITLTGEIFEMEDQRNWTDASFKTYCPPLAVPHPRQYRAGQRVTQRMVLRLSWQPGTARAAASPCATLTLVAATCGAASGAASPVPVRLESRHAGRLPEIGLGLADSAVPLADTDRALLRALRPAHLHAPIDLARSGWRDSLHRALDEAAAMRCAADLEIVVAEPAELADVASAIEAAGERRSSIGRVFLYDRASSQTTRELATAWATQGHRPASGGSRADFAQLNRAHLPTDLLSAVAFAVSPQVHATDDESIMETIAAQPVVARCALGLAPGHPLVVGPITFKPRFNPATTTAAQPPVPGPSAADPRQATALAAAWAAGSIAALAQAGAAALTYFETAGTGGVLAGAAPLPAGFPSPGASYPVFHVLSLLSPLAGLPLLAASPQDHPGISVLAVDAAPEPLVVIANLRPEQVTVSVTAGFALGSTLRRLPSRPAAPGHDTASAWSAEPRRGDGRSVTIDLQPWQVVAMGGPGQPQPTA